MAGQSKAVATTPKGGAVAAYDYGADAGAGFEGTTGADLSIPFISILQSNSPQVEEDSDRYKPGMLFNTVTGDVIDADVSKQGAGQAFLPVHKETAYVEWVPRDSGGGFVGLHDPNGEVVKKAIAANGGSRIGKLTLDNGNELIETHYIYGLLLDADGVTTTGFAVVSFTSTKIKPYRDFTTAMYTLKGRPPMFANRAVIRTVKQKNEKGSFFNFKIEPLKGSWSESLISPADEADLLTEAKGFRDMVTSGMARAAFETQNSTGDGGNGSSEDPPF